jgi:hypothetical protein
MCIHGDTLSFATGKRSPFPVVLKKLSCSWESLTCRLFRILVIIFVVSVLRLVIPIYGGGLVGLVEQLPDVGVRNSRLSKMREPPC